jgi:hypothetical protein
MVGGSRIKFAKERVKVLPGEFPFERLGKGFIVFLESEQSFSDGVERGKVVGREDLSLDDGEVDFNLVEPTGVDGTMDESQVVELVLQSGNATLTSVGRAIIHNPEDAVRAVVGRLGHDLFNKSSEWLDPRMLLASSEDLGPVDVPCCQIRPSSASLVLMLDLHGMSGLRRFGIVNSLPGLDAGLFIRGNHIFIGFQGFPGPNPRVQIEDSSRLTFKLGVSRKNPAAMLPGSNGIFVQPAPDRTPAHRSHQAAVLRVTGKFPGTPAGERHAVIARGFTGHGFYGHDDLRGKKNLADLAEAVPPIPRCVLQKTVCATWKRPRAEYPRPLQSRRYPFLMPPSRSSSREALQNTATYISPSDFAVLPVPSHSAQSYMDSSWTYRPPSLRPIMSRIHKRINKIC